jgi:quercetin dioxygenase-like cupin family protein
VSTTTTQAGCVCLAPGAGETIRVFDEVLSVKIVGAETAGAYAVIEGSVAPGGGPPLHAHPGPETFYVLTGEFAFTLRDASGVSTVRWGPGGVAHAPGGAPHRFENVSSTRGKMLIIGAADSVDFLRELGAAFPPGAEPDMEKMLAIHAKYNIETFHGEEGSRPEPPKEGATSERARALAWRFEQAHEAFVALIEGCPPAQWSAVCADIGRTVGAEAHRSARRISVIAATIQAIADGQTYPPLAPEVRRATGERVAEGSSPVAEQTLSLLRRNGALAAQIYRRLTDEQLARVGVAVAGEPPSSVARLIEALAIGELASRGEAMRGAIGE